MKAVGIVEKRSKEHPLKTRQDLFLEQFPNARIEDGFLRILPCHMDNTLKRRCSEYIHCFLCRIAYWGEEVEESKR